MRLLTDRGISGIEVAARKGKVTLTGMVFAQSIGNTKQLVREVAGVTEVDNRIVVVRSPAGSVGELSRTVEPPKASPAQRFFF